MKKLWTACLIILFLPMSVFATLPIGEVPPVITLSGDDGGRVDGSSWSSSELTGKLFYLGYVDPDEAELNEHVEKAMKTIELDRDRFQSVAIINMDATWLPNAAIASKLKDKQEENPTTIFVKDMNGTLVKKWNLKDDSYDIILVDPSGKVVFSVDGKLSEDELQEFMAILKPYTK